MSKKYLGLEKVVKRFIYQGRNLFARRQSDILSAAAIITIAGFFSSILGLVRNRLLLTYFFENPSLREQLDAYWVAFRLPELVFQLLVIGALSAAFIPVFSKYLIKDKKEAYEISSSVINIVLSVFLVTSVIIFIFAERFNGLITAANFSPEQVTLAANLTRIMLFAQFFFALSNFLTGMIQSQHRFLIPALSPIAYNVGIIAGIVILNPFMGIYSAAFGVVIGAFLHLAFQFPLAKSLGFKYRPIINLRHKGVREMIRLMPPRTLAISVNQLELFASVYLATALSAGSLTIFNLAQQLMSAPIRIFSVPIGQASLPFLSQETSKEKRNQFKQTFLNSLHQILYLALPASALLLVLRIPLVRIVYGAKEFPWSATILTGKAIAILSLSIFAQSATHLLTRAFYALQNTKTPFFIALISVTTNILFAALLIFVYKLGIIGLAIAMSISAILHATLLLIFLYRSIGGFSIKLFSIPLLKMIIATAFTGIFLWVPMRLLDQFVFDTTRTIPLIILTIIVSGVGLLVYLILSWLLNIQELYTFASLIKRIGKWKKVVDQTEEVIEPTSQTQEIKPI